MPMAGFGLETHGIAIPAKSGRPPQAAENTRAEGNLVPKPSERQMRKGACAAPCLSERELMMTGADSRW